jgi:hypothetical protein
MENTQMEKTAFKALMEYARDRMCLVDQGTGNLLMVNGRVFIATCFHVAEEFFLKREYRYVTLRHNRRIPKTNLELIASRDGEIDVALMEVHHPISDLSAYVMDDIELVETFDSAYFDKTNVLVCGNPAQLAQDKPEGIFYTPLTYMTLPDESKLPSSDFLYCRYPMETLVLENQSNKKMTLPAASGLSGAFILKVTPFHGDREQLWSPRVMKVIAIQHRWDTKSYMKGTNVKHLIGMLRELGFIGAIE